MQEVKSIKDAEVSGKRVLLRADFNEPITNGVLESDSRIKAALPTINLLLEKGASKVVILTHLGRPKDAHDPSGDLSPVRARLRELVSSDKVELHENLRFDKGEEADDESYAKQLASLGDVYVDDAFSNAHRAHASMVLLPKLLPSFAGLDMLQEIQHVSAALTPPKGSIALIGGAKFETKIPLITKLLSLYSEVLLGGALANDVIKARGLPFGRSLVSDTPVPIEIAGEERLVVPQDGVFLEEGLNAERVSIVQDIRSNESMIDIGPRTVAEWAQKVSKAPFVLWNGPMGMYEKGYGDGTDAIAQAVVRSGVQALVGGGDTAAAIQASTFDPTKVFISTGGGAMLEYLANGTLPAIEALRSK